jgi:hypothetical protein
MIVSPVRMRRAEQRRIIWGGPRAAARGRAETPSNRDASIAAFLLVPLGPLRVPRLPTDREADAIAHADHGASDVAPRVPLCASHHTRTRRTQARADPASPPTVIPSGPPRPRADAMVRVRGGACGRGGAARSSRPLGRATPAQRASDGGPAQVSGRPPGAPHGAPGSAVWPVGRPCRRAAQAVACAQAMSPRRGFGGLRCGRFGARA